MAADAATRAETASTFVGRERELVALVRGLDDAFAGRGRLFLLSGEPGIGKSRLVVELGERARERGACVQWGRCWEAGGAPAFWPWVQALGSYTRDLEPEVLRAQLGAAAPEIAQILPEVRDALPDTPESRSTDPESRRFQLFAATARFLASAAAAKPLVLVLEDLHAADTPSLLMLQFVASELAESRVLLVATYRDVDPTLSDDLSSTLVELIRQPLTDHLPLRGLSEEDIGRFIEISSGATPPGDVVAAVHAETEGNPLFVTEVVRLLSAEGRLDADLDARGLKLTIPPGVREVITRRLGRLSDECRDLLEIASVLGLEFLLTTVQRVSDASHDQVLRVLDEAAAQRLIGEVAGTAGHLRFSHALVRDALYDGLAPSRRVRLHKLVANALESLYGGDRDPHLAELAHHSFAGHDFDRAVDYARRAGDRALQLLAYEEAGRLYTQAREALELTGAVDQQMFCELLLSLGDAQARAGNLPAAKQTFLTAADLAKRTRAPDQLARAAVGYGGRLVWARAGTDSRLVPLLDEALTALGESDTELRAKLLARLAGALRDQPSVAGRDALSREAVDLARQAGDPATLAYALDGRSAAIIAPDNQAERLATAAELIQVAHETGDLERTTHGHLYRLAACLELGDTGSVDAELAAMSRLADELRQPAQLWLVAAVRGKLALLRGQFDDAERRIEEGLAFGERALRTEALPPFRFQLYALKRERGGLEELEGALRASVDEYPARPMFRSLLCHLYAELGRDVEARGLFEEFSADDFAGLPRDIEWLFSMSLLAEACRFLGDVEAAARLYALLLPHADLTATDTPEGSLGSVSRYLGILASLMGRWDDAERHFEEAIAMNTKIGARPWVAHTECDYAMMLLARDGPGDGDRAAQLVASCRRAAGELGMTVLEQKAAALLGAEALPPQARLEPRADAALFRCEGEYWSIAYEGRAFRLRDSKGLRYLSRLLAEPGREIHALDLVASGGERTTHQRAIDAELEPSRLGDAGELLDVQAKEAYRQRLAELEEEIDEARAFGDPERVARAQDERQFLVDELARAVGLGGRDRRGASAAERARLSVTRAIRTALARIGAQSPALGAHLDRTIRTGTFCSYSPDPRALLDWRL